MVEGQETRDWLESNFVLVGLLRYRWLAYDFLTLPQATRQVLSDELLRCLPRPSAKGVKFVAGTNDKPEDKIKDAKASKQVEFAAHTEKRDAASPRAKVERTKKKARGGCEKWMRTATRCDLGARQNRANSIPTGPATRVMIESMLYLRIAIEIQMRCRRLDLVL